MVGKERGQLVGGVLRVMFDYDRAQAQHREKGNEVLRGVGQDQRYPVAGADSHLPQGAGGSGDAGIQLRVAQGLAAEKGGGTVGEVGYCGGEEIRQRGVVLEV